MQKSLLAIIFICYKKIWVRLFLVKVKILLLIASRLQGNIERYMQKKKSKISKVEFD
jgi:hypothetical protein